MLARKMTIPNLLGATLALVGCGDDPPARPTSMWGAATEAFCMKQTACSPSRVYNQYRMRYEDEICQEEVLYADFAAQYLSAECDELFASYTNCVGALSCDVLLRLGDDDLTSEELDACVEEVENDYALALSCASMLPGDFF